MSHGGPTCALHPVLEPARSQYWTSRGFAVLDVNYGGSTGYGRDYRQRLNGQWGIVDVDDCVNGARYLVERGEVDGERLAITRRQRGRLHDAVRADLPRRRSTPARATTASATSRRWPRTRTSSSRATSTA